MTPCRGKPPGRPHRDALPGAAAHGHAAKPVRSLWELRQALQARVRPAARQALRVVIARGGATGCEIAASVQHLVAARRRGAGGSDRLFARFTNLAAALFTTSQSTAADLLPETAMATACPGSSDGRQASLPRADHPPAAAAGTSSKVVAARRGSAKPRTHFSDAFVSYFAA